MLVMLLICLLVGAVLGQRFRVLVLIPAMALAVTAAAGVTYAGTFWQILEAALVATTSLQIGYFAGVGVRYLTAATRTSQIHAGSPVTSTFPQRSAINHL
jgi:hypothetical protein